MSLPTPRGLRRAVRRLPVALRVPLFALNSRWSFVNERSGETERYSLWPFIRTRSVFVHVPKAAGISIAKSLYGNLAGGHRTYRQYEEIFGPWLRGYFAFTFVRNPFLRLHSAWRFLRKGGINHWDAAWCERHMAPGEDFATFVMRRLDPVTVASSLHLRPQADFLLAADGTLGPQFIGKHETIERDFQHICDRMQLKRGLRSDNRSADSSSMDRLSDEVIARIGTIYADDFALLGYPTTPPERAS